MTGAVDRVITSTRMATSTSVSGRITCVMVRAGTCTPARGCSTRDSGVTASGPVKERSAVLEVGRSSQSITGVDPGVCFGRGTGRGSGGRKSPSGVQGQRPGEGLGLGRSPQKPEECYVMMLKIHGGALALRR